MLRVDVFLRGWRPRWGLVIGDWVAVVGRLRELGSRLLLGECVERWRTGWLGCVSLEGGCEGVVGARLCGLERLCLLLLPGCPGIVAAGLRSGEGLLLLRLLLLELAAEVGLLGIGIVLVIERGLLRLNALLPKIVGLRLLLLLLLKLRLIEARLLRLEAVLESRLLLWESCRLRISIIQIASTLRLLCLLIDRIAKPVNGPLLLIALIVACKLWLLGAGARCIVEKRGSITLFELLPAQLLFFFA